MNWAAALKSVAIADAVHIVAQPVMFENLYYGDSGFHRRKVNEHFFTHDLKSWVLYLEAAELRTPSNSKGINQIMGRGTGAISVPVVQLD
jgi:hypothetical protein